ncbi:protein ORF35 [Cyprinid herpesvirus 3]|uniref:ORF35R n=1 Tax=Cyprinid herpesvirus 3 TaxID=180230 RepID=A3QMK4_CYHV3|nr:unnamed protein product [Cyprinid herpesvirus 3]ABC55209.1 hypothetical protein [Cyprinid herpesvirus 3]ABG42863.1 protein ORF35 [Cyprinid herpesvirus 3]AIC32390.1 ORF35R [Cyprinid herpesvirus 3]AJP55525.1 protein ORF35 [Cyprinid herpesvirus 3]AJP55682.1 protein ORF35 [Cyprinid herpesvirus 3]
MRSRIGSVFCERSSRLYQNTNANAAMSSSFHNDVDRSELFSRTDPICRAEGPILRALQAALAWRPPFLTTETGKKDLNIFGQDLLWVGCRLLTGDNQARADLVERMSRTRVGGGGEWFHTLAELASHCGYPKLELFFCPGVDRPDAFVDRDRRLGFAMCLAAFELVRCSHNEVEEAVTRHVSRIKDLFSRSRLSSTFHFTAAFYGQHDLLLHCPGVTGIHDVEYDRSGHPLSQGFGDDGSWYRDQLESGLFDKLVLGLKDFDDSDDVASTNFRTFLDGTRIVGPTDSTSTSTTSATPTTPDKAGPPRRLLKAVRSGQRGGEQ